MLQLPYCNKLLITQSILLRTTIASYLNTHQDMEKTLDTVKENVKEESGYRRTSAEYLAPHDSLKGWDETRRAHEANGTHHIFPTNTSPHHSKPPPTHRYAILTCTTEKAIAETMLANMEERLEFGKDACNDLLKYVKELVRTQHDYIRSYGKMGNALDERFHYGYVGACEMEEGQGDTY